MDSLINRVGGPRGVAAYRAIRLAGVSLELRHRVSGGEGVKAGVGSDETGPEVQHTVGTIGRASRDLRELCSQRRRSISLAGKHAPVNT